MIIDCSQGCWVIIRRQQGALGGNRESAGVMGDNRGSAGVLGDYRGLSGVLGGNRGSAGGDRMIYWAYRADQLVRVRLTAILICFTNMSILFPQKV